MQHTKNRPTTGEIFEEFRVFIYSEPLDDDDDRQWSNMHGTWVHWSPTTKLFDKYAIKDPGVGDNVEELLKIARKWANVAEDHPNYPVKVYPIYSRRLHPRYLSLDNIGPCVGMAIYTNRDLKEVFSYGCPTIYTSNMVNDYTAMEYGYYSFNIKKRKVFQAENGERVEGKWETYECSNFEDIFIGDDHEFTGLRSAAVKMMPEDLVGDVVFETV